MCTTVYNNVGINMVEVAHDNQVQVKKYIVDDLKLLNSWHGNALLFYDTLS